MITKMSQTHNMKPKVNDKIKAISKMESQGDYEKAKEERKKLKEKGNYIVD